VSVQDVSIVDVKEDYCAFARDHVLSNLGTSAGRLWDQINIDISTRYAASNVAICKPSKEEFCNLIHNIRQAGGVFDVLSKIQTGRYATMSDTDPRLFFKFHFSYEIPNYPKAVNTIFQMLFWSHLDLLCILCRGKIVCYLDGTFHSVPKPFTQCLILMAFDDETNLYVPIVFALVQNKSVWTYWHFLNLVLFTTEFKFDPETITTDFEFVMITAI
jgi:hypothetical protein